MKARLQVLDRYTQISELGGVVRGVIQRGVIPLILAAVLVPAYFFFKNDSSWLALAAMGFSTVLALGIWQSKAVGLPLLPMMAAQHLAAYGIPLLSRNETLERYSSASITQAGVEVGVFIVTLALAWRFGMELFRPRPTQCYALSAFAKNEDRTRRVGGIVLILIATGYNVLSSLQLIDFILGLLPDGTYSIFTASIKSVTMAGYFVVAMSLGSGEGKTGIRLLFWGTLILNAVIMASGILLSTVTNLFAAVVLGLFWSSGRPPWRFLILATLPLALLHLGKFEMRERYWGERAQETFNPTLQNLPKYYGEWLDSSLSNLSGSGANQSGFVQEKKSPSSLLARVDNLQNLLFAIEAIEGQSLPTLGGATYRLIPPLLIPRILWPDKPRTHEGQIMLNVHFGRQGIADTFNTYIAWGLLPEAYGNFGSIWGGVILGLGLGLFFAWAEVITATKPLLSLEGLITFALFMELTVSFENVASVLITALFQSGVIIALACIPFVYRTWVIRPESEAVES
ncbi:MAG: hypothetical protein H2172_03090 [Opitutus sp.]|nr:hypothetical protein [Opitutus sp.]MCS6246098.1 hypothetical protein [Opitutus sp.]MCS6273650.1 hypothetical protein [Opitutus sp.]MCS6277807.1 hypothetical protein [Opitutus sp.]MCS6299087.1 hypothetical protein [Opitutus sp.]